MKVARAAAALGLLILAACPDGTTAPKVDPKAPGAPTIGEATPGNAQAAIAFTAPSDTGTAAIIDYTATCAAGASQFIKTGTAGPLTVTGLTNGTTYDCSVKARNSVGSSPASGITSVTPATVPSAPAVSGVQQGVGQLTVTFTAGATGGSAITGFTASCTPTGGAAVSATGTASPIVVTGLTNGTTYGCSVTATNVIGTSNASSSQNGTTAGVPAAPAIGSATAGNGQLSVSFTAGSSNGSAITGYTASCTPTGGSAKTGTGTSSPVVVAGLTNGTAHSCSVTATNAVGTSAASGSVNGTPATVPGAPTIGTATAANGSISIAFTAPASNGGSAITTYTGSCAPTTAGTTRTATGAASPISVTSLSNGTTYDCTVTATNAVGASAASATAQATPVGPPPAPTIGVATPGDQSASIAFTAPASNGGSAITSYTMSCTASTTTITGTGASSPIVVTGLTNGTAYSCSVKATNSAGLGTASGTVSVTPRTVPAAPTIGTATPGNGNASIAFTAGSNGGSTITGYTVTCTAAGQTTRTGTGTSSPIAVSTLTNDVQYACSVVATNAAGTSAASGTVNVTPTAPVTTSAVMCPYSYNQTNTFLSITSTVSWTCNTGTGTRSMSSNQIPDHTPGTFPNSGNPNAISAQATSTTDFTLSPAFASLVTSDVHIIGWAKNGVKFDPATAETCPTQTKTYCTGASGTASQTYNIEALNQTLFSAGVDNSNAHVQPNGAYHYHGMPTGYMNWISSGGASISGTPAVQHYLIGFAVDGFPIYAKYGYGTAMDATSAVREIKSSWRKKTVAELSTERASFGTTGAFAIGTFTQDFIYDPASTGGDLDECNGRLAKTPDFPNGIYHYYITTDFPFIQRCLKGTVPTQGRGGTGSVARAGRVLPGRPPRR